MAFLLVPAAADAASLNEATESDLRACRVDHVALPVAHNRDARALSGWLRKFFGGSGRRLVPEPGEVDGAGGVEGFLRSAGGEPGDQDGVLVMVVGGGVDGEAEGMGRAAVAQAA